MTTDRRICFNADARFALRPAADGNGPGTLDGYAIVWNQKSTDRGGYKVMLSPGSARFEATTFALFNHSYDAPLARTDNGTLGITQDDYGVRVSIQLPNTSTGKDVAELVKSGIVKGMSFGMLLTGAKFSTSTDADGDEVDTFTSFGVDEVTCTPIPAFTGTSLGVAQQAEQMNRRKPAAPAYDNSANIADRIRLELHRLDTAAMPLAEHQRGDS